MPRFSPPAKRVAHERIDDEVIAIDLGTGSYFSLRDTAADVWTLLVQGADVDGVTAALGEAHRLEPSELADDVTAFVEALVDAGLLVADAESPASDPAIPAIPAIPATNRAYVAPVIEKYDDMEELLLLDPIHEVDEAGWPVLAVEPGEG